MIWEQFYIICTQIEQSVIYTELHSLLLYFFTVKVLKHEKSINTCFNEIISLIKRIKTAVFWMRYIVKFDSILTIVNRLIKYTMFISFKKTVTASVLAYTILRELISNHELLKEFIINRDKLFTSKFWEMFTTELKIKHKMLTAYHSQTDEQSKRMN
jgi:hypothetical protein